MRQHEHLPLVTTAIILVCIGIFAYDWWALGDWVLSNGEHQIWRVPQGGLGDLTLYRPRLEIEGEWYRVVTSAFIHFNVVHLAANMLALWSLGRILERSLGAMTLATLFSAGVIGGSFGAVVIESNVQVGGVSGAVFALMGALAMLQMLAGENVFLTSVLILINLGLSFLPFVALGGHLGGLIAGAAAGLIVGLCRRSGRSAMAIAPTLVAALAFGTFLLLVRVVAPAKMLLGG
ncbi:MAG: membrane associated rhomboid family serine protease [Paracrocinitomix sp.]